MAVANIELENAAGEKFLIQQFQFVNIWSKKILQYFKYLIKLSAYIFNNLQ